jgi:HAD superfamily hydrolase (TIGR01509 family)
MKPEARIYQHAILLAGVPAAQVFFTDDRLENVEGARAVGIDAVLFTSTEQLRNDLRSRGIDC